MTAQDLLAAYEERINGHDFDALAGLIAPDATFWFSDGCHQGRASIRLAFERTWSTLNNDFYWLSDRRWIGTGADVAACSYRFNWKSVHEGKDVSGSGLGTTILRRTNGKWQIVHEHLSKLPDAT